MKITIDENLKGKDLFKFLVENKDGLITQKKSMVKRTDPVACTPSLFHVKNDTAVKTIIGDIAPDATTVRVKVVANTANYVDSQGDMILPDAWKKSIKERKGMIPHLHDHIHELNAEVGDVVNIYSQDFLLTDLGVKQAGLTQALIFETDIRKSYNEQVFNKYKAGKVNAHSIGLQYVKIGLAVNDPEYVAEYELWNKNYPNVINKDAVDEQGYFWVVPEIKLLENSAVLFASNPITPLLEVKTDTETQPPLSTEDQPLKKSFEIKQLFQIF